MIDQDLVDILACPETKADLRLASGPEVDRINAAIALGRIMTRDKQRVTDPVEGALFRRGDASVVYPIRGGIPVLLVEEQIEVQSLFQS